MQELLGPLPAWMEALGFPVLGRLLLAAVLGAAIGLERELAGKAAGLRTNMLISVGAELLTEASILIAASFAAHDLIRADPGRIAAGIATGIGFIGAGTILVARGSVVGLTTAATLWVVAAIGITVGVHAYVEAVGATVLVLIVLLLVGLLEGRVLNARAERTLRVVLTGPARGPEAIDELLRELGLRAEPLSMRRDPESAEYRYTISGAADRLSELLHRLAGTDGVRGVAIE